MTRVNPLTTDQSGRIMFGGEGAEPSRINGIPTSQIDMNRMVPNFRDEKGGLDLFSKLLEERIIRLDGQVDGGMAAVFQAAVMLLTSDNNPKKDQPIQVIINSPGGSVFDGLAMYDLMRSVDVEIQTVVSGMAASMGSILLCAGDKRAATPSAQVMIHQPSGGGRGTATATRTNQDLIEGMWDDLTQIYVNHSGVPHEDWDELLRAGDVWLKADQALTLRLIDEVFTHSAKKKAPFEHMTRKSPRKHFNEDVVPNVLQRVADRAKSANDDKPQADKKPAPKSSDNTGPK